MNSPRKYLTKHLVLFSFLVAPSLASSGILFEEHFDSQPDWHSAMHSTERIQRTNIPTGWYSIRQDPVWAPSTGHPDRHESMEVLASNASKARGGAGKSLVNYRDSYDPGWQYWGSESMLLKYFPEGYNEIYVEFWIRFGDNWTRTDTGSISKLFRISSWRGSGSEYQAFADGDLGPIALWDHEINSYGVRNVLAFRGGPHGDNYSFTTSDISGLPRALGGLGDMSMNFTANVKGMEEGGTDPKIPDRVKGGLIGYNPDNIISHDQIYGPGSSWTKMAFYVKMNSAPGVKDGIYREWINGQRILNLTTIPWIRPSTTENVNAKWNIVSLGGNNFFRAYPNAERHQEWYSIDDVVIRSTIPTDLMAEPEPVASPPMPPSSISVSTE